MIRTYKEVLKICKSHKEMFGDSDYHGAINRKDSDNDFYVFYSTIPKGKFKIYQLYVRAKQLAGETISSVFERWEYEVDDDDKIVNIKKSWKAEIKKSDVLAEKDMSKDELQEYLLKIKDEGYYLSDLNLASVFNKKEMADLTGDEDNDEPRYHWRDFDIYETDGLGQEYSDNMVSGDDYVEAMYLFGERDDSRMTAFTRPYPGSPEWKKFRDRFLEFKGQYGREDDFLELFFDMEGAHEDWDRDRNGWKKWGRRIGDMGRDASVMWDWEPPVGDIDWTGFDEEYEELFGSEEEDDDEEDEEEDDEE